MATAEIMPGELLWEADESEWVVGAETWRSLPRDQKVRFSQTGDDAYVFNSGDEHFWNHSCEPNCICDGERMYALTTILPGEEVTYDYGLTEIGRPYRMACACGATRCRGVVTNEDYLLPELQRQYAGRIPAYVQSAITRAPSRGR